MARSDEAEAFFYAVYSAIQEVPFGKVTTYGHIARLVGTPQRPRQTVPWQRIINAKGEISTRSQPESTRNQAEAIAEEGVEVTRGGLGEYQIDLEVYGWFPDELPSEVEHEAA